MFGKWIGRSAAKHHPSIEALAALGPYAGLSVSELETALSLVEYVDVKAGLLGNELPGDRRIFLEQGSLQIQTHTGFVLLLKAGSPQARYAVPLRPEVVSLYAAEPSRFLCLPKSIEPARAASAERTPACPELSPEEAAAFDELRRYFGHEHSELPSLPDLALKIGKAIDDPNNANEDIARLIQLDPSLTARMISVVNSAAFGGLNKITSINQATARLGRNKVRSLVYSCLLKNIFKINSTALKQHMESIWQHSVYVAALSFVLGRETPGIDSEQAMLAGLIHDIGAVAVIGGINRFPVLTRRGAVLDYAIESMRTKLGLQTLRQWDLHSEFEDVIKDAENWHRIGCAIPQNADVVILAKLHALVGTPRQEKLPRIDTVPAFAKMARGGLTPRHSLGVLEEAEADVREIRALLATG